MLESSIHRLRIFKSVIESGGFNAAARKLNISQPAITAHIQSLEQELGKKLFIREPGRKASLTEAGEIFYSYALEITSKTNLVEKHLQKLQGEQREVTVAVQRSIANNLFPSYLATFSRTHPDFRIIMYSHTQEMIIHQLMEGKADLGLLMTLGKIEGLYSEILTYENIELVVGPSHELASRNSIQPVELEKYSFVGGVNTSSHSRMINESLKKIGIQQYNVVLQLEDYRTLVEVVKRGIGIAATPGFGIQKELEDGELIRLPLDCEPAKIEIRLIYNPDLKMSDETRLFMVFLRREMSAL